MAEEDVSPGGVAGHRSLHAISVRNKEKSNDTVKTETIKTCKHTRYS